MSKTGFGQMYRQLSSKLLDLVVTPHVLGEVPTESTAVEQEKQDSNKLVCYVLQNYSRSNALVVDGETVVIDFNRATIFPAHMSPYGTCPKAPADNRIKARVKAGEKMVVRP